MTKKESATRQEEEWCRSNKAKLFYTLAAVLMCLATARGTNSKFVKTMPTITNSLVNLGKMEIAFYFNGKHPEDPSKSGSNLFLPNVPITRSHAMEPCPCSAFKSSKDSLLSDPSELIDKILRSNDLFKDPTSAHCCDSHEQIQEKTVYFELSPNRAPMAINNMKNPLNSRLPQQFQRALNSASGLFPMRPKAMEIFMFPKRRDMASMDFSKMAMKPAISKAEIQVVGDKEVKPLNEGPSVKKDLTSLLDKKDNDDGLKVETPVTTVNNAL